MAPLHDRKRALIAVLSALLMLFSVALSGAAAGEAQDERVLLVLQQGARADELAHRHGASVVEGSLPDGVAILRAHDAAVTAKALRGERGVLSAEPDGVVRSTSASWDSASWDSASWDSASWDSASWDSASWDSASWDSASWDSASWDSASWDSASWDSASWDSASWDAASWDGAFWANASWRGPVPSWGLLSIRAPLAWADGTPVHDRLVCIVDSGVDASHPALAPNLWRDADGNVGWNFIADNAVMDDEAGHGTHLAGIVAASRTPGQGYAGVGAPWVASAKVMEPQGTGRTSDVIEAISWCGQIHANVILLALSEDTPTRAFRAAIEGAQRAGMLVVAAAGNAGPCARCVSAPAGYPGVLAVGAIGPNGRVAEFSAEGPQVRLVAPGVHIASSFPGGLAISGSGTSQAAAFAAGAAAFVWGKAPSLSSERVATLLVHTGQPLPEGDDRSARALDLAAAVDRIRP